MEYLDTEAKGKICSKSSPFFGLNLGEPLKAETIIEAAYSNPDRVRHPDFARKFWDHIDFCYTTDAKTLIKRIQDEAPDAAAKFD